MNTSEYKQRCDWMLKAMLGSTSLCEKWWTTPNRAFALKPPEDCDIEKVYEYLLAQYDR